MLTPVPVQVRNVGFPTNRHRARFDIGVFEVNGEEVRVLYSTQVQEWLGRQVHFEEVADHARGRSPKNRPAVVVGVAGLREAAERCQRQKDRDSLLALANWGVDIDLADSVLTLRGEAPAVEVEPGAIDPVIEGREPEEGETGTTEDPQPESHASAGKEITRTQTLVSPLGTELKMFTREDGVVCFVLQNLCETLQLGNPSQVAARLKGREKGIIFCDTLRGPQSCIYVTEPGLYRVVLRAHETPQTELFQTWVFDEVLPTIRKTGRYEMPGASRGASTLDTRLDKIVTALELVGPRFEQIEARLSACPTRDEMNAAIQAEMAKQAIIPSGQAAERRLRVRTYCLEKGIRCKGIDFRELGKELTTILRDRLPQDQGISKEEVPVPDQNGVIQQREVNTYPLSFLVEFDEKVRHYVFNFRKRKDPAAKDRSMSDVLYGRRYPLFPDTN